MNSCDNYIEPDISDTPGASIIYTVDWPSRGLPVGATIVWQTFTPSGTTDYTLSNTSIVDSGLQTSFQLTGGIPGNRYPITNQIQLSDTEFMEATLIYECVLLNVRRKSPCI